LPLGSYVIREELTGDLLQSFPETGFHAVTISQSGQQLEGLNFGNYQPIILPDGRDHLCGTEANDTQYGDNVVSSRCIISRGDDDHLYGQQGDDLLVGQLRSDTYHFDPAPVSGTETDTIIELAGLGTEAPEDEGIRDRLDFSAVVDPSESVTVDLTGGLGGNTIAMHAGGGTHEVVTGMAGQHENIEHILGGSADDTLTGNAANNWINGGPGSDLLVGNAGDDTYAFDPDNPADVDTIVETTGNDTLDFSTMIDPLTADLSVPGAPPVTVATVAGQTVQADPTLLENVIGGSAADVIIGNALDNQLEGRAGNDTLTGLGGNDLLVGGTDDDLYLFGNDWGDDIVVELASGGTNDVLDFTAVTRPLLVEFGSVTVTDQTFPTNVVTHADNFIERIDLPPGGSNTIVGADVPNLWIITGPGAGTVNGIAFTEASDLVGGTDVDQFQFTPLGFISGNVSGGSGNDQFDFTADTAGNAGSVGGTLIGGLGVDELLAPDDQGPNAWLIDGLDQGELAGVGRFADIDLLLGAPVADTFTFTTAGVLNGTLDGGTGTDVLDFTSSTAGRSFIANSLGTLDGLAGSVAAVVGSYDNVNQLLGSSTATDSLSGGSGNDLFELTGAGSGLLNGTPFANFEDLLGLIGADELRVSAGVSLAGRFFGGAGNDTVVETGASGTFVVDGAGMGSADGVLLSQIENLLGGSGADTFSFQDGGSLIGTIDGAAGHDLLTFEDTTTGRDITVTGSGTVDGATGIADLVPGFDNIDELIGSLTSSVDTLRGGSGPNTFDLTASAAGMLDGIPFANFENFDGGAGNDLFDLAAGILISGTLDGGLGTDTLDYADFTTAVTVDLGTGVAEAIAGGVLPGTTGSSIEHVLGSLTAGNTLLGDDDHNELTGGAAADLLEGRLGDDTLAGGSGNDQYQFAGGVNLGTDLIIEVDNADTDTLDFAAFGGSLDLQLDSNALQLVDAALLQLTLSGTEAIENVVGSALADMITGNNRDNEIQGGELNDVIFGAGGDDHLFGNNGDDTLFGGLGADTLEGGAGVDLLDAGGDPGDVEIP
jgi:Ca2+-binding RTX toxin-like protein